MMQDDDFRDLVYRMRQAQKEYFRTRSHFVLQRSKELEKAVDRELGEKKEEEIPTLF